MKQTGKRISHGPALVMAQSQEEGLPLPPATPKLFISVGDVCAKIIIGLHFPFSNSSDGQCWKR